MALSNGPNLGLLVHGALGEAHYAQITRQWRGLDLLVQPTVKNRTLLAPPGTPADGESYLVPPLASGGWAGQSNNLARWSGVIGAWEFFAPSKGWKTWIQEEDKELVFNGTEWVVNGGTSGTGVGGTGGGFRYKGTIDCSVNPNYPAADQGDVYSVSVQGRIGGANGPLLRFGDSVYCRTNARPAGTQAEVGLHWVTVMGTRRGVQVLVYGANTAINCAFGTDFRLVLTGNTVLGFPSNMQDGDQIFIRIKQDGTGNRTMTFAAGWKFPGGTVPTLSTAANAIDILAGQYDAADNSVTAILNKGLA